MLQWLSFLYFTILILDFHLNKLINKKFRNYFPKQQCYEFISVPVGRDIPATYV